MCSAPNPGSAPVCRSNGDGLCYQPCSTSSDCRDSLFPDCTSVFVYGGSDYFKTKYVCTAKDALLTCPSGVGGTGGYPNGGGTGRVWLVASGAEVARAASVASGP